ALFRRGDHHGAAVKLTHDVEDRFWEFLEGSLRGEEPTDPKVDRGLLAFGHKRVRRLLDAVVRKRVAAIKAEDESGTNGLRKHGVERLLGISANNTQSSGLCSVSQTGKLLQCFLRLLGKPVQLPSHEVHYVFSEALGTDAFQIPSPYSG